MKVFFCNSPGDYPNQYPPLGLLYLAAAARQGGHEVGFYDMGAHNANTSDFWRQVKEFMPEVFALSLYTTQFEKALQTISELRNAFPSSKIIVGGPHVSALPKQSLDSCKDIDIEVFGEGEITLNELLKAFQYRGDLSGIDGICYRTSDGIIQNKQREHIEDLDSISFPAYDLIVPFEYSYDKFAYGKKVGIAVSSRGCPYHCTFCNKAVFGSTYRRRSPENIIAELKLQKELLKIDEIYFVDDLFVTNKKWLDSFLELYQKSGINLPWKCLGRVDQVDEATYTRMKDNGCFLIQFGVESGDDAILKSIRKNITREKVENAVKLMKKIGLNCATYFIIGHPGDTYGSVVRTIRFAKQLNADICHFFVLVPFPGTYNYQFVPVELRNSWSRIRYYHKGQYPISLCELTPEELYKLEKQARYEFYGRIRYFLSNILSFRNPLKLLFVKGEAFAAFFLIRSFLTITGKRILPKIQQKAEPEEAVQELARGFQAAP